MCKHLSNFGFQTGAALVVSLLFLLVLTLIGISAMQATSLEEKMAGNLRDRAISFEAAESALRNAENILKTQATTLVYNCVTASDANPGLFLNACPPSVSTESFWQAADKRAFSGTDLSNVAGRPDYVIEQVPDQSDVVAGAEPDMYYRVTTRAVGGTATAVTVLQSVYRP